MSAQVHTERGDTLVEVLIATAILAAAVVGGLGIMNFGLGVIYNSTERTQVQASMTSQVSLIRYSRDAFIRARRDGSEGAAAVWASITSPGLPTTANPNVCNGTSPNTAGTRPFYVQEDETLGAYIVEGAPSAATTAPEPGKGLWVEAVRASPTANYVDIYVKACWTPATGTVPEQAKTVVRLYDPGQ